MSSGGVGPPPPLHVAEPYEPPSWITDFLTRPPRHGRLRLANLPTPIHRVAIANNDALPRCLRDDRNLTLFVKRDDATGGAELGGNKIRKLEFLLADALASGADTVVTIGGEQSNHCRATAAACRAVGRLAPRLLLRTRRRPAELAAATTGNLLIDRAVGATVRTLTPGEYGRFGSDALVEMACDELRRAGERPYAIPVGGSNGLGTWGYVEAARELRGRWGDDAPLPDHVVFAAGSGGTAAGIALGLALDAARRGVPAPRLHAVAVCDDEEYFYQKMAEIADEMGFRSPDGDEETADAFLRRHVTVHQGKGSGYAISEPEELAFLAELARATGLVLDPVYTGKALRTFLTEVVPRENIRDATVLFWHTGGTLGLYDKADDFLFGGGAAAESSPVTPLDPYRENR